MSSSPTNPNEYRSEEHFHEWETTDSEGVVSKLKVSVGHAVLRPDGSVFSVLSTPEEAARAVECLNKSDGTETNHIYLDMTKPGRVQPIPYDPEIHPKAP